MKQITIDGNVLQIGQAIDCRDNEGKVIRASILEFKDKGHEFSPWMKVKNALTADTHWLSTRLWCDEFGNKLANYAI